MTICATCDLLSCACRSGKTSITAGAGSVTEARALAEAYLSRRGYTSELVQVQRQRAHVGMIGYQAWRFTYRVQRA